MEHIVQFAIGIDDEAITNKINETAERQIIAQIKKDVEGVLFSKALYSESIDKGNPKGWLIAEVQNIIAANKDLIIDKAVQELAKNMMKTKAVKEAMAEMMKKE